MNWGWSGADRCRRDPEQAADRELKEEAGFGARRVDVLRAMTLAPTYMSHQSWLVVARDLYPEKLAGDEPEELEVIPWKLAELDQLMLREDFSEGARWRHCSSPASGCRDCDDQADHGPARDRHRHRPDAGRAIMQVYADGFDVQIKDDSSPVTSADLAANQSLNRACSS